MKLFFAIFLFLPWTFLTRVITPAGNGEERKLFMTTTWNADGKRFEQLEELKALTRKQYYQWLNHFQFTNELEEANFVNLHNLHQIYEKIDTNLSRSK